MEMQSPAAERSQVLPAQAHTAKKASCHFQRCPFLREKGKGPPHHLQVNVKKFACIHFLKKLLRQKKAVKRLTLGKREKALDSWLMAGATHVDGRE